MSAAQKKDRRSVGKRCFRCLTLDDTDIEKPRGLDHMTFLPDMDDMGAEVLDKVLDSVEAVRFDAFNADDVQHALQANELSFHDFAALLSSAAEPFLDDMAQCARQQRFRYFGSNVQLFTPLYLANYCKNHCVYCGFNRKSSILRQQLDHAQLLRELDAIAATGLEEILLLTGEDHETSSVDYIMRACECASERFKTVGVEVYPMNVQDYRRLRNCGADYVTVFQETYNPQRYERLHIAGRKRVFPYRFEAQERALRAGMRGISVAALLGVADFRRDAYACGLHAWMLQRKYPAAEISFSCPRLCPTSQAHSLHASGVSERALFQILCAFRLFAPYAGITVSSREGQRFRDGVVSVVASKVSAGVSTAVGSHATKEGVGQFEIFDTRDVPTMCQDLKNLNLQPVMNDHVLV